MTMPYNTNPKMPRLRMDAVKMVQSGKSIRAVARHYGYNPSTVSRWVKKADQYGPNGLWIPTESSAPKRQAGALSQEVVSAIITERNAHGRCAEIIHQTLLRQGYEVSLSSVDRTLRRAGLVKQRSKWKKNHYSEKRPKAEKPGDLVQIDTIHYWYPRRFYVYTLLDVYSRWAHALISSKATAYLSVGFLHQAQKHAPFDFSMVQSDHGPEFSQYFTHQITVAHRHSRVRRPNDNAHLERFNRTLKDECFRRQKPEPTHYQQLLNDYLPYYNEKRMHLSLNFQTPLECCEGAE